MRLVGAGSLHPEPGLFGFADVRVMHLADREVGDNSAAFRILGNLDGNPRIRAAGQKPAGGIRWRGARGTSHPDPPAPAAGHSGRACAAAAPPIACEELPRPRPCAIDTASATSGTVRGERSTYPAHTPGPERRVPPSAPSTTPCDDAPAERSTWISTPSLRGRPASVRGQMRAGCRRYSPVRRSRARRPPARTASTRRLTRRRCGRYAVPGAAPSRFAPCIHTKAQPPARRPRPLPDSVFRSTYPRRMRLSSQGCRRVGDRLKPCKSLDIPVIIDNNRR